MGRKSKIEILTEKVLKNLIEIRGRIPYQTYNAYERKIYNSNRTDVLNKLNEDIERIKNTPIVSGAPKLTTKEIKEYRVNKVQDIRPKKPLPRYTSKVIDKSNYYKKVRYTFPSSKTNEDLFNDINTIRDTVEKNAVSITLFYKNISDADDGEKVRSINVNVSYTEKFEEFDEYIKTIESGDYIWDKYNKKNRKVVSSVSSDAVISSDRVLITSIFDMNSIDLQARNNSSKCLFKVKKIEETKVIYRKKEIGLGDCGKKCLLNILKDKDLYNTVNDMDYKNFNNFEKMFDFIMANNLDVSILCNSFFLKKSLNETVRQNIEKVKVGNKCLYGSKILLTDVELVYLYGSGKNDIILYDEFNQHFDIIESLEFDDDVRLLLDGSIAKNEQIIFVPRELFINNKYKSDTKVRYLFFDYETVIDFNLSNCMKPYSVSILNLDNKELEELNDADEKNDIEKVNKIRKDRCLTFLGYDCNEQFISWISKNQLDTAFVFIGFNNANFDNFILLDGLLKCKEDITVSEIFYNGTQLLNFYINGRHNTFDIHKHLMGSLKNNCESFKIKCCAKKSFDHNKAQLLFLDNKLVDFITDNDELKEYNEFDVLATAVLFCRYRKALKDIEATKKYSSQLHNIKTVGSLIYKVFEDSKIEKKFNLPKLDYKEYNDLQNSKIAGRVELFNGVQKVEERIVSTDVCSLYPYVMSVAPVYYPCGDKILTDKYMGADIIGFYYCDIDQSNLKKMNLPNIYAKKSKIENDWAYDGVLENYLISNVMIELLLKYNCKVNIKNGFYFTEKKKSCEMFDFILDFMVAKNGEDNKKKNKDASYNPALRETLKLLMNSLSGKVIEGLHCEKTQSVDTVAEYEKIKSKSISINFINIIGNKLFLTYEMDEEKMIKKQRPIYLGVLIYDYSKSYMFNYSYSKVGLDQLLYTDTDASKFRYKKFIDWVKWVDEENIQVPHWEEVEKVDDRYKDHKIYQVGSKVFGSFEDELEDCISDRYCFYCVEKKSWCYIYGEKSKFRFKGLNENALLLTLEENFVKSKMIKHKNGDSEIKYNIDEQEKAYRYSEENKILSIKHNTEKFFEQIYKTKEAYLLCGSFRKIVKNTNRNVDINNKLKYNNLMNKIQVNFIIKKISIK